MPADKICKWTQRPNTRRNTEQQTLLSISAQFPLEQMVSDINLHRAGLFPVPEPLTPNFLVFFFYNCSQFVHCQ